MSKPLDRYPYYEIHDWNEHQPLETDGGATFIRVYPKLLLHEKFVRLSQGERGVLLGLWLYRGGTGLNPPRDPARVVLGLNCTRTRHLPGQLKMLELMGFLKPAQTRRPLQRRERRVEKTKKIRGRVNPGSLPDGFEEFWDGWPRKVAKDAAAKAWVSNDCWAVQTRILAAVKQQSQSEQWQKDNGRFISYPATWLNGHRWEDEIETTTSGPEPTPEEVQAEIVRFRRDGGKPNG